MAHIISLAAELLDNIVTLLHNTSPESLLALNLTCKTLNLTARFYLWRDIYLPWNLNKNSRIAKFVSAHRGNSAIKSLRLDPQKGVLNGFKIGMKSSYDRVGDLCACLNSLPNLKTFSLSVRGKVDKRCLMPGAVLLQIVASLPASVVNLEIDTEGVDCIWKNKDQIKDTSKHLCYAIGTIIPQLETLRLSISCVCPELFHALLSPSSTNQKQTTSKLRLATIDLEISPTREHSLENPCSVNDCNLPISPPKRHYLGIGRLSPNTLYLPLLQLHKSGAFPHLQRFLLFTVARNHFRVRDVTTGTLTQYPLRSIGVEEFWTSEPCPLVGKSEMDMYMVRAKDSKTYYGTYDYLYEAVMWEVTWKDGEKGERVPPSSTRLVRRSVNCETTEPMMDTTRIIDVPTMIEKKRRFVDSGGDSGTVPIFEGALGVTVERVEGSEGLLSRV